MPTSAWAIIPSAGERRGQRRDRRQLVLAQGERGGVVHRPVGQAADARGGAGAQGIAERRWHGHVGSANRVVAACRCGRWLDRHHALLSRDDPAVHRGPVDRSTPRHSPGTGRVTSHTFARRPVRRQIFRRARQSRRTRPRAVASIGGRSRCGRRGWRGWRSPSSAVVPSVMPSTGAASRCGSWRRSAAWAGWGVGAIALAVTGLVTLTAVRAVVPIAVVVAGVAAVAGRPGGERAGAGRPGRGGGRARGGGRHRPRLPAGVGVRRRAPLRPASTARVPRCRPWCRGRSGRRPCSPRRSAGPPGAWVLAAVGTARARRRIPRSCPAAGTS